MNVISIIKLLPESNEQVLKFSGELNNMLDSGEVNPLDVLLCIKGFEKVIKNVKENLNSLAVDELLKYSEKDISYKTAELKIVETGVSYDYSNCNDVYFNTLKSRESTLKEELKGRETFLKAVKDSMNLVDVETGETYEIFAPVKTSTTVAKVTLK